MRWFLQLFPQFRALEAEIYRRGVQESQFASIDQERKHLAESVQRYEALTVKLESDEDEWKRLFLEERDKHTEALELVADWEAQRLMGRQIFHHAPLLQPERSTTREKKKFEPRRSARDVARQETAEFNAQASDPADRTASQRAAENQSADREEQKELFDKVLTEYEAAQQLDQKINGVAKDV